MAVVSLNELPGAEAATNDKGQTEYTRRFQIIVNSPYDGPQTVCLPAGIPRIGDPYATVTETDLAAVAIEVRPKQDDDNWKRWEVEVRYGQVDPAQTAENPLNRPADISYGFAQFTKVCTKDVNGKPLLNSAGDYFDPPPEIDDSRPVITIARNEAGFNSSIAEQYKDAVNSDAFFGYAPGKVKVANISSQRQIENGFVYWRTTYEFHINPDKWNPLKILNIGRWFIDPNDSKRKRCPLIDGNGNPLDPSCHGVDVPVTLKLNGDFIRNPDPNNVQFREFTVYTEMPFAALHLP